MNIPVIDQSDTQTVDVRFEIANTSVIISEIVSQLRKLDAETFRNTVKIAKKIRRGDRIVAAAEKAINDK